MLQLRGERQGISAPAEKQHVAGAVFTVPAEAQAQERREAAAVEVKLGAGGAGGGLAEQPGQAVAAPPGLPGYRGRGGAERERGRSRSSRPCAALLRSRSNNRRQFLEAG